MPNAINPDDYNIDYFSSGFLGITTAGDFREYLLNNNLQDLPPELITGAAGNFTDDFSERGVEKDINYAPITNPGSIDEWNLAGNFEVSLFDISYQNPSQNVGTNQYGPPTIQPYNEPGLVPEETGFIQYPTSSGGDDFKSLLKENLLSDQLNLGPGSAVNFPSPLNDIAKERRKEEALNKLKLKAENQILGKLNLDPFGLLAGQDLILKDYKITTRPTVGGKLLEFVTDAAGLEIPTSPIPDGAFGKWGDQEGPESYKDLLKSTGAGTKSLIFNSVSYNKYGPTLQEPRGKAANLLGAGQAPQAKKYTDNVDNEYESNLLVQKEKPLVDRINQKIGQIVSDVAGQAGVGVPEGDLRPREFESIKKDGEKEIGGPSIEPDDISKNSEFGFDTLGSERTGLLGNVDTRGGKLGLDTWGVKGPKLSINDDTIGTNIPFSAKDSFRNPQPETTEGEGGKKPYNNTKPFKDGMYWGGQQDGYNPFRRGLLKYTQDLVNKSRGNSKSRGRYIGIVNDGDNFQIKTGRHKNYSMGNTVFEEVEIEDDTGKKVTESSYCRSWSVRNPYRKVKDLIRHGASNEDGSEFTSLTTPDQDLSVLGNNGFVKVAPYLSDGWRDKQTGEFKPPSLKTGNPTIQKYMLSIENLAWQNTDHLLRLPPCEVGPNGGRIMWFPPYDISFTDNSSVNWDSTQIIGRGEPIYTYNSTERTGTLAFKIVVDHSTVMTEIKKDGELELFKYFAGCKNPIEAAIPILPIQYIEETKISQLEETTIIPAKEVPNPPSPPEPVAFFFRNAYRFDKDTIGTTLLTELSPPSPEKRPNYPRKWYKANPNGYLRGTIPTDPSSSGYTNDLFFTKNEQSIEKLNDMVDFLLSAEGKRFKINIVGKTSDAGVSRRNKRLGRKRADTTKDYMLSLMQQKEIEVGRIQASQLGSERDFPSETTWKDDPLRWNVTTTGEQGQSLSQTIDPATGQIIFFTDEGTQAFDPDGNLITDGGDLIPDVTVVTAVNDRTSIISLEYNPEIDDLFTIDNQEKTITTVTREASSTFEQKEREATESEALAQILAARASRYMAWECSYFEKMKQEDSFVYDNLQQKLKYFHPAFHSMTPEGFNARLTFLKQCTRQGPNIAEGEPSNLAFGKPPICVLRVGDFYHTKIVIDSVNLTFDPIQWDLNPEGIGVQPMLCSVDLNFKFIGGSSLGGPISQLQNAVGFNFFANTGLYNPRTIYSSTQDYNKTKPDASTGLNTDISNGQINNTDKTNLFGFGAYIKPNEVIYNGDIANEENVLPPPVNEALENIKRKQIEDARIEAEQRRLEQEKIDAINEQFDKKVEERAGAFTAYFYTTNATLGNPIGQSALGVNISKSVNLCSKQNYTNSYLFIRSNQESLSKVKITYPSGVVKTFTDDDSDYFTFKSIGADPETYWLKLWGPDKKGVLVGVADGIQTGLHKITVFAEVSGTLTEDGTSRTEEISVNLNLQVSCCSATDGSTTAITDIPESGNC